MNQYEIEERASLLKSHSVLGEAARFLNDYKDVVNSNSDGWAYVPGARKAAQKLVDLLLSARQHPWTVADVKKAVQPIKSFCTRKGLECPRLPYSSVPKQQAAETPLDLLEELLAISERYKALMTPQDRDQWQRISAKTADLRDGN